MSTKKIKNNSNKSISTVERTSNVATIVTTVAHGFVAGDGVYITCSDATYDVSKEEILSIPTSTSFTYANAGSDDAVGAETGTAGIVKRFQGQELAPDEYYELQPAERSDPTWIRDAEIISEISSGDWVVNNGTTDLSASEGNIHFQAKNATCIQGVLVDDVSKADQYVLMYDLSSDRLIYAASGSGNVDGGNASTVYPAVTIDGGNA